MVRMLFLMISSIKTLQRRCDGCAMLRGRLSLAPGSIDWNARLKPLDSCHVAHTRREASIYRTHQRLLVQQQK